MVCCVLNSLIWNIQLNFFIYLLQLVAYPPHKPSQSLDSERTWYALHNLTHLYQLSPSFILKSLYLDDMKIVKEVLQHFTPRICWYVYSRDEKCIKKMHFTIYSTPGLSVISDCSNNVSSLWDQNKVNKKRKIIYSLSRVQFSLMLIHMIHISFSSHYL